MFFLDKISFPGQTVHFGLYHVLHILKAIVPADNLSYQKGSFEHRMRRFLLTQWDAYVNSILPSVIMNVYDQDAPGRLSAVAPAPVAERRPLCAERPSAGQICFSYSLCHYHCQSLLSP